MAFDAGKINKGTERKIVVQVNTSDDAGQTVTHTYHLRQISRGEMVQLVAEGRKKGGDALGLDLTARLFENGEEVNGGQSIYDLIDAMDDQHQESFFDYISKLATASQSQLASLGIEVQ